MAVATLTSIMLAALRRAQTKFKAFKCRSIIDHGPDLHIGAGTRLWAPARIKIGKQVYIGKDVHIEANCRIGDYCLLANRVAIIGKNDHDYRAIGIPIRFAPWIGSKHIQSRHFYDEAVIESDVWLGYGSIVLTGVTVGKGSIIAAGSVVTRNIPPYSIAGGVPASIIGRRFENSEDIQRHEDTIARGNFIFSERGYDYCQIDVEPQPVKQSSFE